MTWIEAKAVQVVVNPQENAISKNAIAKNTIANHDPCWKLIIVNA
jgi:hypothetical protein